jgi:hypothetical protein
MSQTAQASGAKGQQALTRAQIWLYVAGYVILVAGSVASAMVYRGAAARDANDAIISGLSDTKRNEYRLEMYGGKANVLATEIHEWFAGLWHGRHLAYTLAVLAFAAALICFLIAFFLPDLPAFDDTAEGRGE